MRCTEIVDFDPCTLTQNTRVPSIKLPFFRCTRIYSYCVKGLVSRLYLESAHNPQRRPFPFQVANQLVLLDERHTIKFFCMRCTLPAYNLRPEFAQSLAFLRREAVLLMLPSSGLSKNSRPYPT